MTEFDAATTESILALLSDEDFMAFIQEHQHEYSYRESFLRTHMPCGLDPAFVWEFLSFMRRMAGKPLVRETNADGIVPLSNHSFWTATPDMIAGLNDIVTRTNPSAKLSRSLDRLGNRSAVQQLVLEELEAAAFRDGIDIERDRIREIVCEEYQPACAEERLFANFVAISRRIGEKAEEPPSIETFANLHESLQEGAEGLEPVPFHAPAPRMSTPKSSPEDTLASVAKGCKRPCQWGPHPLFGILLNADIIWVRSPFVRFNGLMELLIRWRSFHAIGVPALRFVPLSSMRLTWERRLIEPPEAPMRYGEALVASAFGIDSTPYIQQIIQLLGSGLDRLERIVQRVEASDERCKRMIEEDGRLGLRQKNLLHDMIDDPTLIIDVSSYERRFDIATSTARTDLTRLVSLNLLFTEFRNNKQFFWLRPDIIRTHAETEGRVSL
ncbi:hypothetical protein [Eggerthella sinensis]|uniref:hypothetical protein n=1 Tax=Eggerthella sinensis TaxID=242230 RepID=UPI0022E185E8|nr:hypothetical protein [Eggerthella sinensis]